jgi:Phosphotyrosine-binding domain
MTAPMGVSRVREMARAGAIWPLRVKVIISNRDITVIDARTNEEMEHFPMSIVSEPTSAMATDRRAAVGNEPLDNIVLFTVLEDPVNRASPPEMHIFQCLTRSVSDAAAA